MKKYLNQVIKYLKTNSGKLILLLVTGIAIRVVVSAIFFHGDLRSTYIRAYAYLWGDLNLFSTTLDFIPHLIEMLVLFVYRFFVPDSWLLSLNGVPISFSNSFEYLNLFVYKLPYILFDIANFFIIKKLFDKDSKRAFWANIFYFLNPILIFSVYAWGRYEVIPIFFILYGFLLYKRDKIFFANIIWGLSILSRASFLLFVPVISILTGKNIREKIKNLIVSTILPILIVVLVKSIYPDQAFEHIVTSGDISEFIWGTFLVDSEGVELPVFFIGYTIIGYFALVRGFKEKVKWEELSYYIGLIATLMYAFLHMHPQYYAWGIPFFAIVFSKKEYLSMGLVITILLTLAYPLILLTWDNDVMKMLVPISYSFAHKDLIYFIDHNIFPSWRLIYFGRAVSSGVYIIIMVYLLYILDIVKTFKEKFKLNF